MDLHECRDEILAEMFVRGEQSTAAFELLLQRMMPVLYARVESAWQRVGGAVARDDLLQEATMAFLSAVTTYQTGRGASLRTFVSVCVSNRLNDALRKHAATPQLEQLLENALPPSLSAMDPQDLYAAMEDARRLQQVMAQQLTALERNALQAHMDGIDYNNAAKTLGISIKAMDNALQRARRKLLQHLP
ncbi:MAG: sigma-70 family RNA polymerase sigma factor [Oscillospiraceae bacterium]|nr:sigma-70 family RNA polymerase sigma factor [Oscillospiraceae bacterium]